MNAATVRGPRSRTKSAINNQILQSAICNPQSSILLDRHERLAVAAPDQNPADPTGRDLLQLARRAGSFRHRPTIDRDDDVGRPRRAGGSAFRFAFSEDGPALSVP